MQIINLKIINYKCLLDFNIDFNISHSGSSAILIGKNGSGKSTMIEVVLRIIASFYSNSIEKEKQFDFYIKYLYAGEIIEITRVENQYIVKNLMANYKFSGKMKTIKRKIQKENIRILPKRVITFYSGYQDKLKPLYNSVNAIYASTCTKTINSYCKYATGQSINEHKEFIFPDKQFNYCSDELTPVLLSSILLDINQSYEKDLLKKECGFAKVCNIEIELTMSRYKGICDCAETREVPECFWTMLNFIEPTFEQLFKRGFQYRNYEKFYFSLEWTDQLEMDKIDIYNAFEKLQTLFGAKYEVTVKKDSDRIKVSEMSEGQRQLVRILGMLGLYKNEDCLVLMDEPDSHMNPMWKYNLKSIIDDCLKDAINTQALIATHDPLVLNGVPKEQIKIFEIENKSGFNRSKVYIPTEDTQGLGIDGLLQSQYYGLKTSYDKETSDKYQERQLLYIKLINKEITVEEKLKLRRMTKEIGALPVSNNTIDFLYDDFMSVFRKSEFYNKEYLEFDQLEERRKRIREIISALYEG